MPEQANAHEEGTDATAQITVRAVWAAKMEGKRRVQYYVGTAKNAAEVEILVNAVKAQFGGAYDAKPFTVKEQKFYIENVGEPDPLPNFVQPEMPRAQRAPVGDGPVEIVEEMFAITGATWRIFLAWQGVEPLWPRGNRYYSTNKKDPSKPLYNTECATQAEVFPKAVRDGWASKNTTAFQGAWPNWVVLIARSDVIAARVAKNLKPGQYPPGTVLVCEHAGGPIHKVYKMDTQEQLDAFLAWDEAKRREEKAQARAEDERQRQAQAANGSNGKSDREKAEEKYRKFIAMTTDRGASTEEAAKSAKEAAKLRAQWGFV